MKQTTAVEWLKEQIEELINAGIPQHIIEQAKQLERQQIIDAFKAARIKHETNDYGTSGYSNHIQYYTENFSK